MKELLLSVINNEKEMVDLPFTPIKEIEKVLKELGVNIDNVEGESVGWEVDFWYTYEGKYELSGSLRYGDMSFRKK